MLVELKYPWFAPTLDDNKDPRGINGTRYARGVQELPDELEPFLPKDAVIKSRRKYDDDVVEATVSLRNFDGDRAAGKAEDAALAKAEATRAAREEELRAKRVEGLAKARAAKAAKAKEAKE